MRKLPEYEGETKRDIAKRLAMSNEELWVNLSEGQRAAVVNKYYKLSSVEHMGIRSVLESNRNLRRNLGVLIIGVLLGSFGSMVATIAIKYLPSGIWFDILAVLGFLVLLGVFIQLVDEMSAENLAVNRILENLLELVRKDQEKIDIKLAGNKKLGG